jgi:hypothetical protein
VEADIWQHYQASHPGQVQVLGADIFNGSAASLQSFENSTGVTFPLLRNAASGAGNENFASVYADRHNYAIVSRQGVVRYHAFDLYNYGNRYDLDEIRAVVDSLLLNLTDVDGTAPSRRFALAVAPTPFRASTTIELTNPAPTPLDARIAVHDLAGRRIVTPWSGAAPNGVTRVAWDGRSRDGSRVAPGVYLIRSEIGEVRLGRRVVVLQ